MNNCDYIQDLLLVIEVVTTYNQSFTLSSHVNELSYYAFNELQYHMYQ